MAREKKERTQPKVIDETWSDERVQSFLRLSPYDGSSSDYHVLSKAYQYMVAGDYARFIGFFVAEGRDLNALSPQGHTVLDRVSQHQASSEYADILREAGAKLSTELNP